MYYLLQAHPFLLPLSKREVIFFVLGCVYRSIRASLQHTGLERAGNQGNYFFSNFVSGPLNFIYQYNTMSYFVYAYRISLDTTSFFVYDSQISLDITSCLVYASQVSLDTTSYSVYDS